MTQTMIERAAQAYINCTPFVWEHLSQEAKTIVLGRMKAAILAMREPSEGMRNAAAQCDCITEDQDGIVFYPNEAWQAMIDAAIEEGE